MTLRTLIPNSLAAAALVLCIAPATTSAQSGQSAGSAAAAFADRNPRYRIGCGDILELDFPLVPEYNQTVTVQPDGFISVKTAGDLHVQGLTSPQLVEALRKAYAGTLRDPVITVSIKDFQKPYFVALGKVMKPGKYDLRGDVTLTQAVAIAGGLDDAAKHSQVLLLRRAPDDRVEVKVVNMKEMLRTGKLDEDLHLQTGDMVFVPKSRIAKIQPWIPSSGLGLYLNNL
jgi:polysaccharide export outer membrane protein